MKKTGDRVVAKQKYDGVSALVLAVVVRVYEVSGHRIQPWYVDRSAIQLADATFESVDQAINQAEVNDWLVSAGEPPQSVAITAAGVKLLQERGMI